MHRRNNCGISALGWWSDVIFEYGKGTTKTTWWSLIIFANNKMIVNETKTKLMIFGKDYTRNISFNNRKIELVREYEYVGNIIRSTTTNKQAIFSLNYVYLRDRANRSMFAVLQRLKNIETPPPEIMFHIFDTLIMPILTYGSDVWGYNKWFYRYLIRSCCGPWDALLASNAQQVISLSLVNVIVCPRVLCVLSILYVSSIDLCAWMMILS